MYFEIYTLLLNKASPTKLMPTLDVEAMPLLPRSGNSQSRRSLIPTASRYIARRSLARRAGAGTSYAALNPHQLQNC